VQTKNKQILLGILALIAIAVVIVWSVHSRARPEFNFNPVPKNAPTLNEADIEKVLGVEEFRVFRRVHQVPITIKESFSNFTNLPFDLSDPGSEMSTDNLISGKSSRRLVFLGLSGDSALLVYEQGGFSNSCNIVVFWFGDGGRGWAATLESASIPEDIPTLNVLFRKRKFQTWERQR
jgi:hypothetical protein